MRIAAGTRAVLWEVAAAAVSFSILVALVVTGWEPLVAWDRAVTGAVNDVVAGASVLVDALHVATALGGRIAVWVVGSALVVWLLVRRLPRHAVFAALTGLGAAALSPGTKALVDRARPVVDVVLADPSSASFPSGHALGSTVTYGLLLVVLAPAMRGRSRRILAAAVVALVAVIGLTRVALGVHFVSDVIAGWLLGVFWLATTTGLSRRWRAPERGGGTLRTSEDTTDQG